MSQQIIRKQLLTQRRQLTAQQQCLLSQIITQNVRRTRWFRNSRHVAFYMAMQREVDPQFLLQLALRMKKKCYLPVLHPFKPRRLVFVRYEPHTRLVYNRYGILEPILSPKNRISPRALDVVFAPLVGFDTEGHRLGMGGGYYDTTFAFLRHSRCRRQPKLIGLAYDFQQVQHLSANPWDVPLHAIVTQRGACRGMSRGGSTF